MACPSNRRTFGRVHAELGGRERENQPAVAGIDEFQSEDIPEHARNSSWPPTSRAGHVRR